MGMTIEDAIAFAAERHRGQTDKAGRAYIWHPLRIAMKFEDEDAQMAAVLHDVVEDTSATLDELRRRGVPERVIKAIEYLTKRPEEHGDENYLVFMRRAKDNELARRVKRADLLDNSDPVRLAKLDPKTREGLRRRYAEALAELEKE